MSEQSRATSVQSFFGSIDLRGDGDLNNPRTEAPNARKQRDKREPGGQNHSLPGQEWLEEPCCILLHVLWYFHDLGSSHCKLVFEL